MGETPNPQDAMAKQRSGLQTRPGDPKAYQAGLVEELAGLEARVVAAKADKDKVAEDKLVARIKQVQEQMDGSADPVETPEEKTK